MDLAAFDAELARERAAAGLPEAPPPPPPPPVTAPAASSGGGKAASGARRKSGTGAAAARRAGGLLGAPDPAEPVYCYCQRVSYGDMVACDNPDCAVEWFHYACAGVTEPPKGKWYCRECAKAREEAGKACEGEGRERL